MLVGLTFDLKSTYLREGFSAEEVAEFDKESTVEGIDQALHELGYATDRIGHVKQLADRLIRGDRWDIVFNICEGMYGIGREALVPALLDAYRIPYTFSDPLVSALTLHKGMTKQIIRAQGINTPDFAVIQSVADLSEIHLPYPLFVKPVAEGTGKGISGRSKINGPESLREACEQLLAGYPDGLIAEEYLPGREFTVGITGTGEKSHVIGLMEIVFKDHAAQNIYSLDTKTHYERLVEYTLPASGISAACGDLALNAWKILGCRDAGRVDIRMDKNDRPAFLEVNPLAGLDKVHSDLPILAYRNGYTYYQLIQAIMDSACERM